jgi:branched-chain amino acid transport system ATP-binding protein/branched-chain amino acid transport system permease protein
VTGGGIGIAGPTLPAPLDSQTGFYLFCLALAALCTWMTLNIAASRFGRALVGLRDAEVAAEAMGISKVHLLVTVFLFSGATAASPVVCSRRCRATSRPTPSPSTSRSCSSSRS